MKHKLTRILCIAFLAVTASNCTAEVNYQVETVATGLDTPWGLALLPDGSALVTEKSGQLRHIGVDGVLSEPIENVPEVYFAGQGGLFDVILHPGFIDNGLIYLSYAEGNSKSNATTIARARLVENHLENVEVIYSVEPRKDTAVHYGGRIAFLPDGSLLLTTGDGFNYREAAQDINSGLGKVMRMNDDGSPAHGNPFPDSPFVYTYGHRNPQGLAVAEDGTVWLHEHGPKGGDEVNVLEPGLNYGWPAVTYGLDYSGATISPFTTLQGMTLPEHYWVPSIAPSGLAVSSGEMFPGWDGDLLVGALVDQEVRLLGVNNGEVVDEGAPFDRISVRIRDIRIAPDGSIYIVTNGNPGEVLRVRSEK